MVLLFPFKVAEGHVNSSLGKSRSHLLMKALLYPRLNYFKKTIPHKAAAHASIAHMWQYPVSYTHLTLPTIYSV